MATLALLDLVQRGVDYVEANLDFDIQSVDVAHHAGISQWHFQRVFKALTNETLMTYIRSRRFSRSLDALANTRERVLDIALSAGFDTQESFTRAFKKAFSVTPAHYRKHASALSFMRKIRIDKDYLDHIHGNLTLVPEIIEQSELLLVGMRTRFFGIDSEKNNMANKLPQLWNAFLPRLDEISHRVAGGCYGVLRQLQVHSDELEYWAAAPVTQLDSLPRGLSSLRVPAATYARFAHRGFVANINMTVNYIYSSWLLSSGRRHTYGCDLEFYGAQYEANSEKSVIYYAIPITPE
jgi:AraC family transcriptional regulator